MGGVDKSKVKKGFTLVELLIVIVVVAILASISVIAYNGIQDRARASEMAAMLSNYKKHFKMVYVEMGRTTISPTPPGNDNDFCVGSADDYPATAQFPAGVCVVRKSTNTAEVSVNTTINSEIKDEMSTIPSLSTNQVYENQEYLYRGSTIAIADNGFELSVPVPSGFACPQGMTAGSLYTTRICYYSEFYN